VKDEEGALLLQWAAPRLGLRWRGFKNVRRQVVRRIAARMKELGLAEPSAYRARLEHDPTELEAFRRLCFVTISRFYRDHRVYDALCDRLLPEIAGRASQAVHVWSAGCASGEEPYSVMLVWRYFVAPRFPKVTLAIVATDFDEAVLERARAGVYEEGSLRELPTELRERAFTREGDLHRVRDEVREGITFMKADVRRFVPDAPLDLVLCRNVVFTYFDEPSQRAFAERVCAVLRPGGCLIVGSHESVSEGIDDLAPHPDVPLVYRRR
jgi:chemotaxis protein methyltransferase CheR